MGDPDKIPEWYLLAKEVKIHQAVDGEEPNFNVEFTFFGDVFEEILFWDAPNRYVYQATGKDFPITDYVSEICVESQGEKNRQNDLEYLLLKDCWRSFSKNTPGDTAEYK